MDKSNIDIRALDLVFVDTETTGLELNKELIEIGFVKADARTFEVLEEGDIKIIPEHIERADPESLAVVRYDPEEWKREGMTLRQGVTEFLRHTEGTMLVGHNLLFDWMHLQKAIESCGLSPNYFYKGLDTFSFAWLKLNGRPEFNRFSLSEFSQYFGIGEGQKHRAIDDARTTYKVFLELMK